MKIIYLYIVSYFFFKCIYSGGKLRDIFSNASHLKQMILIWIKYRSVVITQDRSWWLNMRINYKSNHICYLIIQILIMTLLAQLVRNTRLMLEMGGYLASVPKREASVAKRWRDGKCQLASCEGSKPEQCAQELVRLSPPAVDGVAEDACVLWSHCYPLGGLWHHQKQKQKRYSCFLSFTSG